MTGLAEAAAGAYLEGWALTGAPFTDRAHAGCYAAAGVALDHPHDPGILEAALDLGKLEGTWAVIYRRRERLLRKHLAAIGAAWDACMKDLDPADVVRRFRRDAYLTAETATKNPTKKWWQDVAAASALGWLYAVYHSDGYDALVAAIEAAIRDGMAEGEAGALALAASRQGKDGFRIARAFKAALALQQADHQVTQQARDVAGRMIDGAAYDVSMRLAKLAGEDAGEDEMTSGTEDVTTGDGARSARSWADWALWAGIGAGAMGLFRRAGDALGRLAQITWYDVGDSRECPRCMQNAAGSPYAQGDVPDFPAHPRCRCSLSTDMPFPLSFLAPFLP